MAEEEAHMKGAYRSNHLLTLRQLRSNFWSIQRPAPYIATPKLALIWVSSCHKQFKPFAVGGVGGGTLRRLLGSSCRVAGLG